MKKEKLRNGRRKGKTILLTLMLLIKRGIYKKSE